MSVPAPRKRLPAHPSVEHLKKQAKRLAKQDHLQLAEAQHRVAKEYGALNWAELLARVATNDQEQTLLACAQRGDGRRVAQLMAEDPRPPVEEQRAACAAAAQLGHIPCVDQILYNGFDVNTRYAQGETILHYAAQHGHQRLVERLLSLGADPEAIDASGAKPLDAARNAGHEEVAKLLDLARPWGEALAAMRAGDAQRLAVVMQAHPLLAGLKIRNQTLLHTLCEIPADPAQAPELARVLVQAGVPVDARNAPGPLSSTALHWAASGANGAALCEALLDLGADVDARTPHGDTPLTNAISFGLAGPMQVLLKRGAKLSVVLAAALGELDRVKSYFGSDGKLLPGAGDPPLSDASPEEVLAEALGFAAGNGHLAIARFLLDHGAPVNGVSPFEHHQARALHRAACRNHAEIVKLLLERGADVTIKDRSFSSTPAGWAEHHGHHELAKVLRNVK